MTARKRKTAVLGQNKNTYFPAKSYVVNVVVLMPAIRESPMQPIHFMFLTVVPRETVKLNVKILKSNEI